MSKLESKLDGSKKEHYSHARLEGDLYKLSENAARSLGSTREQKLFGIDLSRVQVIVSKNTAVGSNIFPGKHENIVYGTAGSKFPTQKFYPDEKDDLRGDFFVQAPDSDGFKEFKTVIEIPKKDKTVSYTNQNSTVQTPKTEFNMYLTGQATVMGDSRPGKQEFSYSIDGGNTFLPAANITDWSKVTHVKLDLGELPKGSQVNIKLPLKTNAKTTTDELEAYIGGSFETTDYTGFKMNGYINPAKYVYGNFAVISSDVWWDKNENGKLDDGEKKVSGLKLELYSPDQDITINKKVIAANTLIDSVTTDSNGRYELKSFMLNEGQWIKVTMPNGKTKLTLKAEDLHLLESKNSDFDRTTYKTPKLPELVREKPLDSIGCGLIRLPEIKTETVKIHVGEESGDAAAKGLATSDHPTENPVLKYVQLSDDVADVDSNGKVRGKNTGKIKAEVTATNTLAASNQAMPEDTVKGNYDIIVYGNIIYDKNHDDVSGQVPKDNKQYYPSVTVDGKDANTDKVTVLDAGTMKKSGYKFKGWNSQEDGKGTMYAKGDTFKTGKLGKDIKLYAIWSLVWTPMIPPTREIKVTKEWQSATGSTIEAPVDKVEVELYKDDVATGDKLELTKDNNWTGQFKNLQVANGLGSTNYYQYTVKEIGESGSAVKLAGKWYGVKYGGTMKDGLTVTNKEKITWTPMIPATRYLRVTKEWKEAGRSIEAPVEKIEVELYKDDVATGKKLELTKENNWKGEFKGLELEDGVGSNKYYKYTVKEVGENNNAINFSGRGYKVLYKGTMKDGLTITNERETYSPFNPGTNPDPDRIDGGDRIETGIKISQKYYDKAKTVIVVRHDLFPDSMTASVLAKLKDAPILLNPTNKLDPRVGAEIKRLGAEEVIIVGGPDSISEKVRGDLKAYDKDKDVERIAGVDRYGTSEMVARRVTGITGKKNTGVIASGQVFPDALSVGTFASRDGYPILLVKKNLVPDQVVRAIKALDINKTYIAGGTNTISKSTEAKLPGVLERMAGKDRYETSVAIAKSKFKDSTEAFIASGEEFADALVISPISGKYNKPTLLASRNKNTNAVVKKYIEDAGLTSIIAIGGEKYLPYSVLRDLVR